MDIDFLANHKNCAPWLATVHYELWGPLTGLDDRASYERFLRESTSGSGLPITLVAFDEGDVVGSANLVACDLPVCDQLTPWLAQLYVFPESRSCGVGAALVRAVIAAAKRLAYPTLFLYASGDVPLYYERIGWRRKKQVEYLGKTRTIMEIDTFE